MRARTAVMLALATLAASPAAFAQRASLADRVAALEARAAADRGATELVNQIGQLRAETQELRGQIRRQYLLIIAADNLGNVLVNQ